MAQEPLIVFVGHDGGRTGAPMSLLRIVEWFARNAAYPRAVILGNGGALEADYARHADLHVWNQPYPSAWDPRRLANFVLRRLGHIDKELLSEHQSSIVRRLSGHGVGAIFNNTGLNGNIIGALKSALDAPVVSRIPELEAYMRKNNLEGSADATLALSDHFIAVSQAVKDNLVRRHAIAPGRITVIHGACAAARVPRGSGGLREKLGIPADAFVAGGCGTMDWRKGVDLFIQVADRVAKSRAGEGIYFCWIGGCVSQASCIELHYEVELHALGARLFFLGEVPDTAPYLADLDLFLLPSREDPFPLVVLEAARQGVPIACFEGSGGATEFVDAAVGVTVPMLDVAAMAGAVEALRQAPGRRAALGEAAHRKSLDYTAERMGRATLAVLQDAIERQQRR
jgi:glycosyltransferase involved in cell wall biosynthesis